MPFLGNLVNTALVVVGSILGLMLKKGVSDRMQEVLMQALGMCTVFIGISGTLENMTALANDGVGGLLGSSAVVLLIISMVVGTVIGQLLNIEGRLEGLGDLLRAKMSKKNDTSRFTEGFVSSSLIICVGAMAIVGGITDGMGQPDTLLAKGVLDFVVVLIFSSTMGIGVLFSAAVMFLYQGIFGVIGFLAGNIMTDSMITGMSVVGNVLIFGVGVNLLFGKVLDEHKVKVGNMLPALIIPVIYSLITALI